MNIDLPGTITALSLLVTAIGAILAAYWSYRAKQATKDNKAAIDDTKTEIVATKAGLFELGKAVDGRLSKLLEVSISNARAEGIATGEQSQRDRSAASDKP
jgi:hypothetical protein